MSFRRLTLLLVTLSALTRCGGGAPELEVGTGRERFEPLATATHLDIWQGPQGGYHLFVNVRARGLNEQGVRLDFAGQCAGKPACSAVYPRTTLVRGDDGWAAVPDGALCFVDDPAGLAGLELTLSATAVDVRGNTATDIRRVRLGEIRKP